MSYPMHYRPVENIYAEQKHCVKADQMWQLYTFVQAAGEKVDFHLDRLRDAQYHEFADRYVAPYRQDYERMQSFSPDRYQKHVHKKARLPYDVLFAHWFDQSPFASPYQNRLAKLNRSVLQNSEMKADKRIIALGKIQGLKEAQQEITHHPYLMTIKELYPQFIPAVITPGF